MSVQPNIKAVEATEQVCYYELAELPLLIKIGHNNHRILNLKAKNADTVLILGIKTQGKRRYDKLYSEPFLIQREVKMPLWIRF